MGNAINCKTVPIAAHIAIVTIFLVLLFINTNPPKFRIPLQTNLLNFLDSLLVGARQSKNALFSTGKRGHLTIGKSNTLYLLYPDFTVGIGISPIQLLQRSRSWTITTGRELHPALKTNLLFIIHVSLYTKFSIDKFLSIFCCVLVISLVLIH